MEPVIKVGSVSPDSQAVVREINTTNVTVGVGKDHQTNIELSFKDVETLFCVK